MGGTELKAQASSTLDELQIASVCFEKDAMETERDNEQFEIEEEKKT